MTESAQDQAQGANEASVPVGAKIEAKRGPGAKATKWAQAPDVVGEESGKTGQEDEPKGDAAHGTDEKPQTQAVTDTAGTVNDAGPQDGDAAQVPARAENDPLGRSPEPASNVNAPEAMRPEAGVSAANRRPLDAPVTGDPASDAKADLSGQAMFRDDRDHPHFAGPMARDKGKDETEERHEQDLDARSAAFAADNRTADLDAREKALADRETEVSRREQAAQPQTATITDRDVDAQIVGESYVDGGSAFAADPNLDDNAKQALGAITLCALRLRHGGVVIGSAEADGQVAGDTNGLRAAARADARQQVDAGMRFSHRMKVAGI